MDNRTAMQFMKLTNIKVEERFGCCLVNIEPGAFCVFDKNTPSNGIHFHNCYEMCIVTGGSGEFLHDGELVKLQVGDVFIANPGFNHEIRLGNGMYSSCDDFLNLVFFRINIFMNADTPIKQYEEKIISKFLLKHAIISRFQTYLFSYLNFIERYSCSGIHNTYGLYQVVKNMALEGLFSLVDPIGDQNQRQIPPESLVDRAIDFIGANLDRRLYLSEIAASVFTSERNLQHLFSKNMKKSITDYINQRKTAVAAGYLKMNFKISEVSNLMGINDIAQFSRLFKRYYGMSPKRYQMTYSHGGMMSGASFSTAAIDADAALPR